MTKFDILLICIFKDTIKIFLVFFYLIKFHKMKSYVVLEVMGDYYFMIIQVMTFCSFVAVYIVNPLNNIVTRAAIICAIWTSKDWLSGWICTYGLKKYVAFEVLQVSNPTYIMKKLPVILLMTCLVNFVWAWLFEDTEPDDFYTYKLDPKTQTFYKREFITSFTLNHWNIKDFLKFSLILVLYKGNLINKDIAGDFFRIFLITFVLNIPLVLVFKLLSKKIDRIMRTIIIFVLCNIKDYLAAGAMLIYLDGIGCEIAKDKLDPFYIGYLTKKFPILILLMLLVNIIWAWFFAKVEVYEYFYIDDSYYE